MIFTFFHGQPESTPWPPGLIILGDIERQPQTVDSPPVSLLWSSSASLSLTALPRPPRKSRQNGKTPDKPQRQSIACPCGEEWRWSRSTMADEELMQFLARAVTAASSLRRDRNWDHNCVQLCAITLYRPYNDENKSYFSYLWVLIYFLCLLPKEWYYGVSRQGITVIYIHCK